MLLTCWLSHRGIVIPRLAVFFIFVSVYVLVYLCLIYVICFFIFIFITINHIISLTQKKLLFGHVSQMFSLKVLFNFCLNFCQFQPGVAFKSVAYKKERLVIMIKFSFIKSNECQRRIQNPVKQPRWSVLQK